MDFFLLFGLIDSLFMDYGLLNFQLKLHLVQTFALVSTRYLLIETELHSTSTAHF